MLFLLETEPWNLRLFAYVAFAFFFYFLIDIFIALIGTKRIKGEVVGNVHKQESTNVVDIIPPAVDEVIHSNYPKVQIIYKGKKKTVKTKFRRGKEIKKGTQVTVYYHPKRNDAILLHMPTIFMRLVTLAVFLLLLFVNIDV